MLILPSCLECRKGMCLHKKAHAGTTSPSMIPFGLPANIYHRQMGMKHSKTSWKRCFLVKEGVQDKGWSSLISAPGAGWQSCAVGLKTHTCLPPPDFIQAPQMYKFHIDHAGGLMSTKEFTLIFWLLLMHRVHLLFSSPDNCAMGIGLEYV